MVQIIGQLLVKEVNRTVIKEKYIIMNNNKLLVKNIYMEKMGE